MVRPTIRRTIVSTVTALALVQASLAQAQTLVVVETSTGNKLTGVVDLRTDDEQLWLRFERPGVMLIRPLAWSEVERVDHGQESLDGPSFQEIAVELATEGVRPSTLIDRRDLTNDSPRDAILARRGLRFSESVCSIDVSAHLANWDADVENDGLLLRLEAIDGHGQRIEATGVIEAELLGFERQTFSSAPHARGKVLKRIGRWRIRVDGDDFRGGVAVVRLPFRGVQPERDTNWAAYGMLQARFVVPGEGAFHASVESVRVRAWSPTRDAL